MKILMTTMGLDLGGAETHIAELSKTLAKKGCDVTICSNGGVFVQSVEKCGVKHVEAPLNVRGIFAILRSTYILFKWVRQNKPDVIHAHARIPAFISNIVGFLTRTPMVTTAHFNFTTDGIVGRLTRWGKRSIAVSEDIKKYLVDNYHINEDNISLTVNGINTSDFSSRIPTVDIDDEFDLSPSDPLIVNVSRMDHNACLAAFELIEAAQGIHSLTPDAKILIVGSGDALDELRAKAAAINAACGTEVVTITGGRTDIPKLCARASLFVGVSRAALEAMACETPVIFAGNQGFLGLFDKDKLPECYRTNFTFRGIGETTAEGILAEYRKYLQLGDLDKKVMGRQEREIILKDYSVNKMAQDALDVYYKVYRPKSYDFLLCGYYGYKNMGDEALLAAIAQNLHTHRPCCNIAVLTKSVKDASLPQGCFAFNRFNLFSVTRVIKKSNVLLFGGGNLIQDVTSTKSLIYYLFLLRYANINGVRTMLYANGIGPLVRRDKYPITARILNGVDVVTLRESRSAAMLKTMGVTSPYIEITADEVFTLPESRLEMSDNFPKNYFVLSIRNWDELDRHCIDKLSGFAGYISKHYGLQPIVLSLNDDDDEEICKKLADEIGTICFTGMDTEHVRAILANAKFTVGMRLHSLVFSVLEGVPAIGISYDSKIISFLEYIGIDMLVPCDNINIESLVNYADVILDNYESFSRNVKARSNSMKREAVKNAEIACELIDEDISL